MALAAEGHGMGGVGGTLDYMAPELLLGGRTTITSDLYSLGVLFHVMLTGEVPERRSAPRPLSKQERRKSDSRASTKTLGPVIVDAHWQTAVKNLPSPWAKVVARCLAPRPENRYRSAEAVSQALQARRPVLKWSAAVVATATLALGYWQWSAQSAAAPVRLAVLPFSVEGDPVQNAGGIGLDVADHLAGARRNFTVISPLET